MVAPRPLLLLTRPEPASRAFVRDLSEITRASVDILINPLLSIHVTGPLPSLNGVTGLIFTSANALDAYRTLGGEQIDIPAITVGETTGMAARALGFAVDVAGGTAEHVVQHVLESRYRGPLLHLKGAQSIGNIAQRLTDAGVPTGEAVIYRQESEVFKGETKAALSQDRPTIAPVFSPRTARQLRAESEGMGTLQFAAISASVADALGPDAASRTRIAQMPSREAMVRLVADMVAKVVALERPAHDF